MLAAVGSAVRSRRQGSIHAAEVTIRHAAPARLYATLAVVAALDGVTVGAVDQAD